MNDLFQLERGNTPKRIVVAMSGGVDSSVVAALAAQSGAETIGITLQLYDHGSAVKRAGSCCAGQDIRDAHAVVISDYAKGVITPAVARHAIATARAAGLPVVVDPKQADFTIYAGATVITPNLHELELAAPTPGPFNVERIVGELLPALDGAALLVTRSADGMTLFRAGASPYHVAAIAREVFDVTGAGDTVVATLALALAAQLSLEQAIELASVAAAVSVSKRGTSTVSSAELLAALDAE